MRSKEEKCKRKGQETTIGKIIYGFLLFLPLLAIGVTCLVTTFNKNVGANASKTYELESVTLLDSNTIYYLDTNDVMNNLNQTGSQINFYINLEEIYYQSIQNNISTINRIIINNNTSIVYLYNNNSELATVSLNQNVKIGFTLNYFAPNNTNTYDYLKSIFKIKKDVGSNIQDVFYYSIDKVTESPLFNWAENSFVYTTTETTCTQLHITTPFIPLLISYWLIISVIYFLFDIALMLVWTIHKKIHELQESI